MALLLVVIYYLLFLFWLLLLARIIVELIRSIARDWHPTGAVAVVLELVFSITDPPVKLLRRLIPPIRIGQVRLDISIMVLVVVIIILMNVVGRLMPSSGIV